MCTIYAGISTSLIDHGRSTMVAVPRTTTPWPPHRGNAESPRGRGTTPRAYRLRLHRRCRFPRLTPSKRTTSWLHRRLSARTNPVASAAPPLPTPSVGPPRPTGASPDSRVSAPPPPRGSLTAPDVTRGLGRLHRTTLLPSQDHAAADTLHGLGVPFVVHAGAVDVFAGCAGVWFLQVAAQESSTHFNDATPQPRHLENVTCQSAIGRKGSTFRRALAVSIELHQQQKQKHQRDSKNYFEPPLSPPQQHEDSRPPPSPNWPRVVAPRYHNKQRKQRTTITQQQHYQRSDRAEFLLLSRGGGKPFGEPRRPWCCHSVLSRSRDCHISC